MFDIGFQELVLVLVIALLIFGPEKLPEVGRTLGKWLIEVRKGIQNAKVQMEGEFEEMEKKRAEEQAESLERKEEIVPEKRDDTETSGKEE